MSFLPFQLSTCASAEKVQSFIADAEIVAWDPDTKSILPFQVLTTRKRKVWGLNSDDN